MERIKIISIASTVIVLVILLLVVFVGKNSSSDDDTQRRVATEKQNLVTTPTTQSAQSSFALDCRFEKNIITFQYPCAWGEALTDFSNKKEFGNIITFNKENNVSIHIVDRNVLPVQWSMFTGHDIFITDKLWQAEENLINYSALNSKCEPFIPPGKVREVSGQKCEIIKIGYNKSIHRFQYIEVVDDPTFIESYTFYSKNQRIDFYLHLHTETGHNSPPQWNFGLLEQKNSSDPETSRVINLHNEFSQVANTTVF